MLWTTLNSVWYIHYRCYYYKLELRTAENQITWKMEWLTVSLYSLFINQSMYNYIDIVKYILSFPLPFSPPPSPSLLPLPSSHLWESWQPQWWTASQAACWELVPSLPLQMPLTPALLQTWAPYTETATDSAPVHKNTVQKKYATARITSRVGCNQSQL